jgi:ectoine hydroxylase-related dioxygenase (phytanoyl-CoA dioxygenase family)
MMDTIMTSGKVEETFAGLGFCKLDFTGEDKIEALKKLYTEQLTNEKVSGMMVSHNRGDYHRNLAVSEAIHNLLADELELHFPNHRFFVAHFIVKEAGNSDSFQLHQDWNIVDESKYNSYQLWLPLQLSYPENGGMFFVPRSQHFNQALRSGSFGIPRVKLESEIYPYLSYARLYPGQAAIFSPSLLHGSFSNATPENRISVLINLVEKEAITNYYHFNKNNGTTEIYPIDAAQLLAHLPALEQGLNPLANYGHTTLPAPVQNNAAISLTRIIDWIKADRAKLNLPADYEFRQYETIRDPDLGKKVNHDGYAVIKLLTEPEIAHLRNCFAEFFPDRSRFSGRYNSMNHTDSASRKEIHNRIQQTISNRLELYFKDYYSPISILYSKHADGVNDTDWHTDPSLMLNQHLEPVYTLWCPLLDIGERNGVLQVVPGSHRLVNKLISTCFSDFSPTPKIGTIYNKYRTSFNLKAGEAILFDARLVHGSLPNVSDVERDCIVLKIAPIGANYINVTPTSNPGVFNLYRQNDDYFYSNVVTSHSSEADTGELIGPFYYFKNPASDSEIELQLSRFGRYELL